MKASQEKVKKFNEEREWGKVGEIKDLLLNMNEEIGEFWNIIKWIDEAKQKEMIENNKGDVGNFIGDMQYLLLKTAAICNIDSEEELDKVLEEVYIIMNLSEVFESGYYTNESKVSKRVKI